MTETNESRERCEWMLAAAEADVEKNGLRDVPALVVEANRIVARIFDAALLGPGRGDEPHKLGNLTMQLGALAHQMMERLQQDAKNAVEITDEIVLELVQERCPSIAIVTTPDALRHITPDLMPEMVNRLYEVVAHGIHDFVKGVSRSALEQRGAFGANLETNEGVFMWDGRPIFSFSIKKDPSLLEVVPVIESRCPDVEFDDNGRIVKEDS